MTNRKKNIEIRYVVEGNSSPLCIRNDMGVKLYVEIKKHEAGFGTYPLCIDTSDKGFEVLSAYNNINVLNCTKNCIMLILNINKQVNMTLTNTI